MNTRFLLLAVIVAALCLFGLVGCGESGDNAGLSHPPSVTLTSSITTVAIGQPFTLTWVSENADTVSRSNFGAETVSGSKELTADSLGEQTFTITVANSAWIDSDSVTVNVVPAP